METEMPHIFNWNCAGLVEQLMAKTQFWEQERNKTFYYDEVRPHELQNWTDKANTYLLPPSSYCPSKNT